MPDIYLRSVPSDANLNDVRLYDPTTVSGKVDYALVCTAGSYSLSGMAATLKVSRTISCAAGAYSYTGGAATLTRKVSLVCDAGAYTYTGVAASLKVAHSLACAAGAYVYTGNEATLTYATGGVKVNYVLVCDSGSYSYTGQTARLEKVIGPGAGDIGGWRKEKHRKKADTYADNEQKRKLSVISAVAPELLIKVQSDKDLVKVKQFIRDLPSFDEQDDEEALLMLL